MISYEQAIEYLYTELPVFQHQGPGAYKPGLERVEALAEQFGNPHRRLRCIHVAGTNGKGSTAHTLAAVLQSAGLKVGLFTSPHLIDFRERIRINGRMISEADVASFVDAFRSRCPGVEPSFFELTTMMAFDWFARSEVDIAVIECGLGGRLDSTNIITPMLSVITNISPDHTALLGSTLAEIAAEKAGIIKPGVPVVIGQAAQPEVRSVFMAKAEAEGAPITFADTKTLFKSVETQDDKPVYIATPWGDIKGDLTGECQAQNANTVLHALKVLSPLIPDITAQAVSEGFARVCSLTGLMGRWMHIDAPVETVCDTGHNVGGWEFTAPRLKAIQATGRTLHMVIGFVNDKDVSSIMALMPRGLSVHYYFVQASVVRALPSTDLAQRAHASGLPGEACGSVMHGYKTALSRAAKGDFIFVGGSTFVVADLLQALEEA